MQLPQPLALALIAALVCASGVLQPARADEMVVKVTQADVALLRSPDIDGQVIRVAAEGEEFVSVTIVNDFYLVKDIESGAFLYLHFALAEGAAGRCAGRRAG
jgi:hypothetical protein